MTRGVESMLLIIIYQTQTSGIMIRYIYPHKLYIGYSHNVDTAVTCETTTNLMYAVRDLGCKNKYFVNEIVE
jgi:hypothetical protein